MLTSIDDFSLENSSYFPGHVLCYPWMVCCGNSGFHYISLKNVDGFVEHTVNLIRLSANFRSPVEGGSSSLSSCIFSFTACSLTSHVHSSDVN